VRTLERNKQTIYYALYEGKKPLTDEYENPTGEYEVLYSKPVLLKINVSACSCTNSVLECIIVHKF
jgi:hypothetical protein